MENTNPRLVRIIPGRTALVLHYTHRTRIMRDAYIADIIFINKTTYGNRRRVPFDDGYLLAGRNAL